MEFKKNAQIILVTIDFIFIMIKEMRLNLILYKKNMIILQKIHKQFMKANFQ